MVLCVLCATRVAAEKWEPGHVATTRTWYSYGAQVATTHGPAASLTMWRYRDADTTLVAGWFAQTESGLDGGKASIGFGAFNRDEPRWLPTRFAAGAKFSVLRTWTDTTGFGAGETLIGPEVDLTFQWVKMTAGYLWRTADRRSTDGVATWGVGIGF